MARGWESKDVDAQIDAAEAERAARAKPAVSEADRELVERRAGLELARARIMGSLESVRNERYREQLAAALEHVDAQIRAIDGSAQAS